MDFLPVRIKAGRDPKEHKVKIGGMDISSHVRSISFRMDTQNVYPIVLLELVRVNLDSDILAAVGVDLEKLAEQIKLWEKANEGNGDLLFSRGDTSPESRWK